MVDAKRADLVLEGGGVLGIAHVGAVVALEGSGYAFERVAGTSAGSIVGALAAAGMSGKHMYDLLMSAPLASFLDRGPGVQAVPVVGETLSLLLDDGMYRGERFREWLGNELAELSVETFADLRLEDPEASPSGDRHYKLVVIAADLTRGELLRLPWDYRSRYDLDPDNQLVVDAVRASMAVPFFFEPARLTSASGIESVLVDGGVLSNFPIDIFDRTDGRRPRWPTFGIKLIPELPASAARIFPLAGVIPLGPLHLLESLVVTMIVGHDQAYLAQPWVRERTIMVELDRVNPLDFRLDEEVQQRLYVGGLTAAEGFLKGWDWERYLERHRI